MAQDLEQKLNFGKPKYNRYSYGYALGYLIGTTTLAAVVGGLPAIASATEPDKPVATVWYGPNQIAAELNDPDKRLNGVVGLIFTCEDGKMSVLAPASNQKLHGVWERNYPGQPDPCEGGLGPTDVSSIVKVSSFLRNLYLVDGAEPYPIQAN